MQKIFRAPIAFFDITPLGRILNLFARHQFMVDEYLADSLLQVATLSTQLCLSGNFFFFFFFSASNIEYSTGNAIYSSCCGIFGADRCDRTLHDHPCRIDVNLCMVLMDVANCHFTFKACMHHPCIINDILTILGFWSCYPIVRRKG